MYCTFYGLKERPFTLTPNPEFIFLGTAHQEAFAHLLYGIGQKVGFIALTGEVGAGKTTVIRTLLTRLEPDQYATALILNPMLSSLGLLKTINREFGIADCGDEPAELVETLNRFLLEQKEMNKTVVLVIDEAQDMEPAVLEQVRLLSNLETATEKLIQIILVGQPELETLLSRTELRQLNQRITVRYHMLPMNAADTRAYLAHRLRAANGTPDLVRFSDGAAMVMHRFANGLPRLVNAVADRALLIGYNQEARLISKHMAQQAIREVAPQEVRKRRQRNKLLGYALIVMLVCVAGIAVGARYLSTTSASSPQSGKAANADCLSGLLQNLDARTSALDACRIILKAWQLPFPPASGNSASAAPDLLLQQSGLNILRFSGNLGGLARMGYPAILELLPHQGQVRYLVFAGLTTTKALVADRDGKLVEVSAAALEQVWNGRALVPWRNMLGLTVPVPYLNNHTEMETLARLLIMTGNLQGGRDMTPQTIKAAVQKFQTRQGLKPDGVAGGQTLLLLYRHSGEFRTPTL